MKDGVVYIGVSKRRNNREKFINGSRNITIFRQDGLLPYATA